MDLGQDMQTQGKVLVVGSGIAGLSTAWALARRGFQVEVFEQGQVPNARASSYDEHRITRHAYGDFKNYARLMPEAFRVWDALFSDIGARHYDEIPMLVFQREPISWFESSLASLAELGIAHREVSVAEIATRLPMIAPEGISAAFETGGAGVLFPIRILTDLVVHLASRGGVFHPGSLVTEIDPEHARVTVNGRIYEGDQLVVAAGAWVNRLVPETTGTLVPSRQAVAFLAPPVELADAWRNAPVILDLGEHSGTYTLPPRPGTRLKIGDHHFTRAGDPDGDRLASERDIARLAAAARLAYRDFDRYTILERKACYYTVTEDESFAVRPLSRRTILQSACSGHGFKLGPLIGEGVARAVAGETPRERLSDWAAARLID